MLLSLSEEEEEDKEEEEEACHHPPPFLSKADLKVVPSMMCTKSQKIWEIHDFCFLSYHQSLITIFLKKS